MFGIFVFIPLLLHVASVTVQWIKAVCLVLSIQCQLCRRVVL